MVAGHSWLIIQALIISYSCPVTKTRQKHLPVQLRPNLLTAVFVVATPCAARKGHKALRPLADPDRGLGKSPAWLSSACPLVVARHMRLGATAAGSQHWTVMTTVVAVNTDARNGTKSFRTALAKYILLSKRELCPLTEDKNKEEWSHATILTATDSDFMYASYNVVQTWAWLAGSHKHSIRGGHVAVPVDRLSQIPVVVAFSAEDVIQRGKAGCWARIRRGAYNWRFLR